MPPLRARCRHLPQRSKRRNSFSASDISVQNNEICRQVGGEIWRKALYGLGPGLPDRRSDQGRRFGQFPYVR